MRASELIKLLQDKCKDEDLEVEFHSYEWDDDLEGLSYHERYFEKVCKRGDTVRILISR